MQIAVVLVLLGAARTNCAEDSVGLWHAKQSHPTGRTSFESRLIRAPKATDGYRTERRLTPYHTTDDTLASSLQKEIA